MTTPHTISLSPVSLLCTVMRQRTLLKHMIGREIHQRYRGSLFGVLWSLITPLLLLSVYTFVFTSVMKVRWANGAADDSLLSKGEFAIFLFSGLILYTFFVECITRAPILMLSQANLVKKVIFPLELLPITLVGSALFTLITGAIVLLAASALLHGGLHLTVLWLPLIWLPFVVLMLGAAWILSSLGVYLRDLTQLTSLLTMLMMFLSPIFYPVSALPAKLQAYAHLNPLSFVIEQTRAVLIEGVDPNLSAWMWYSGVSIIVAYAGFVWFQKTRHGFADIL